MVRRIAKTMGHHSATPTVLTRAAGTLDALARAMPSASSEGAVHMVGWVGALWGPVVDRDDGGVKLVADGL
jgi:hypothetical protein